MTKNYEYIEQLLDSYFECQTTVEEEQILRAFFAQENVPVHLLPYRKLFREAVLGKTSEYLGNDFDEQVLSQIGEYVDYGSCARVVAQAESVTPVTVEEDSAIRERKHVVSVSKVHVTARKVSFHKRLRPLYKSAACVAVVLALGQAAQMPYYQSESERQQSLERSLEQLQQIQKDKSAVAKSDSLSPSQEESMKSDEVIDALQN